jgi:hypothetical protein
MKAVVFHGLGDLRLNHAKQIRMVRSRASIRSAR